MIIRKMIMCVLNFVFIHFKKSKFPHVACMSVFQCTYYQVGDIVSLVDDDDKVYYAQIRGFLQDQYYEKSAVITWLLPTSASSKEGFDPSTYILGKYRMSYYHRDFCFQEHNKLA